jgi:hypothetical protein
MKSNDVFFFFFLRRFIGHDPLEYLFYILFWVFLQAEAQWLIHWV